jgi:predicted branched-subunit amino acid permease
MPNMRLLNRTNPERGPAALIALSVLIVGIAYGSLAVESGFPPWLVVAAAVLILGASSELLFVGVIADGGLVWVAVGASLLVNLRNVVYGASASSFLPAAGWRRWLLAHLVNDESVAFATRRPRPPEQLRAFRTVGLAILLAWPLGALMGAFLGYFTPDPSRLGLDAAFPAILIAVLFGIAGRRTILPALAGAAIALLATPVVPAGMAPLLGLFGLAASVKGGRRGGR